MEIKLDPWQQEVMETKGNMVLRSGRQVGKSTVIGLKAAKYALENPKKLIMVISKTERQAGLLFAKILFNIQQIDKKAIKKGRGVGQNPTKHKIVLVNGSVIHCLPAGDTGFGIMGFTIDLLIADEAAFIPEEVWNSIIPALALTRGAIWLLSTPFVKQGYYYNCFSDPTFTSFHTSSEDCPRKDEAFLEQQKKVLTRAQYAQMYLGEFVNELSRFFSDELIKKCCTLKRPDSIRQERDYFLGVDIARMGEDDSTFEVINKINNKSLIQVESLTTSRTLTTDTTKKIIELNNKYDFKQIYIDSAGVGAGVLDQLLEEDDVRLKVEGVENASKNLDYDGEDGRQKKMVKEDLYTNLLMLMEKGLIQLLDDLEIKNSLRSVQFEYSKISGKMIISGIDTHHAEGLIRGAKCSKDKTLNIWIA